MSTQDGIRIQSDEPQLEEPQLGGQFFFSSIGHVQYKPAWDCGSAAQDCEVEGVSLVKGQRVYVVSKKGENGEECKTRAETARKEFTNSKYLNRVVLASMPLASITNRTEESKAKSKFPLDQGAARVAAINPNLPIEDEKQDYAIGFQLIVVPSIVDAWARHKGWYKDPLFDPGVVSGIGETKNRDATEDASFCLPTLVAMRTAIWNALGEDNWLAGKEDLKKGNDVLVAGTKSAKLKEALGMYGVSWDGWVEMAQLADPAKRAYYPGTKEVTDDGGNTRMPYKRNRVPAFIRFFNGEKDAMEEGKRQIAAREGGDEAKVSNGKDYASLFPKLSKTAKETYSSSDIWEGAFPELADAAVKADNKPKQIALAKEYLISSEDVVLVRNL